MKYRLRFLTKCRETFDIETDEEYFADTCMRMLAKECILLSAVEVEKKKTARSSDDALLSLLYALR